MSSSLLSAGDYIASKCTKCGQETNHTIVAMVDDVPVKVQCNTCSSAHKYRKLAAAKKPAAVRKPAARRSKADPQAAERQQWQELESSLSETAAVSYSMEESYKLCAVINHLTFGLGQIQEFPGTRKMLVLFAEGTKVLRCA